MFVFAAVFSATLRAPVSLAGNAGALLVAAAVIQTGTTSSSDQVGLLFTHRYAPSRGVAALRTKSFTSLPFAMCNTQPEAASPGAVVKIRDVVTSCVARLLIV